MPQYAPLLPALQSLELFSERQPALGCHNLDGATVFGGGLPSDQAALFEAVNQICDARGGLWDKLELKAVDAGTTCVTTDDAAAIKAGAETHAACLANTLASADSSACLRGPTSSSMEEAWNGLIDAIVEAGEYTKNHPFYDTELDRAEGMRRLLRTLIVALEDGMDDKGFPYFARRVDLLKRGALDNPDNTYYFARIEVVGEAERTFSSFVRGYTKLPVRVKRR